jgi:hypothetical protein
MNVLGDNVALAFKTCNKQRAHIAELEAQLAALDWREITEKNLPDEGCEIWGEENGIQDYGPEDYESTLAGLREFGWTHFRPINPPPAPRSKA